jgi:hypothetical protein
VQIRSYPRDVFVGSVWQYRPGEHVSFVGKTQSGKTTLAFQLLDATATPALPVVVLVMKPKDATPERWGRTLGIKRVRTWPPPTAHPWAPQKPRGWLLWPKMGDIRRDADELAEQFDNALSDSYSRTAKKRGGDRIVFADEVVGLAAELGLRAELDAVWMRGSSMGLGLWAATQRPFYAPLNMYSQAVHLFLHRDPDKNNRDRLKNIGGVDPKLIESVMTQMQEHQFLYIRRTDYTMCVVDA